MFIHHVFITGCSDRGAWPWRTPVCLNAWWHLGDPPQRAPVALFRADW